MTLWDKLEHIRKETTNQEIDIILFYNNIPITDRMDLASFRLNISLFILDLDEEQYEIIEPVKFSQMKYLDIYLKKEVFEYDIREINNNRN